MASPTGPEEPVYGLPSAAQSEAELKRLDAMHTAVTRYLKGALSLESLADVNPKKILELGCGSGAWAIQAAEEFPDAEVVAVDISPLPDRPLPANMKFKQLDVSKDLPFEEHAFDVVHARFVMCHVVNGADAVARAARLVKAGGLLLIEDVDIQTIVETGGPAVRRSAGAFMRIFAGRGTDHGIGRKLKQIIERVEGFNNQSDSDNVSVHKVAVLMGGKNADEALDDLARGLFVPHIHDVESIAKRFEAEGLTAGMVRETELELKDPGCETSIDVYFCSARRV